VSFILSPHNLLMFRLIIMVVLCFMMGKAHRTLHSQDWVNCFFNNNIKIKIFVFSFNFFTFSNIFILIHSLCFWSFILCKIATSFFSFSIVMLLIISMYFERWTRTLRFYARVKASYFDMLPCFHGQIFFSYFKVFIPCKILQHVELV
jgi:hypothetical protein